MTGRYCSSCCRSIFDLPTYARLCKPCYVESKKREQIELQTEVETLRAEGITITDPLPADSLFHDEARKTYDAVVCLYHDQALIPVKTLDFWGGVNATLGLPIVRTSPDHGTGFDIAGKGVARADSLIAAIRLAGQMAAARAAS